MQKKIIISTFLILMLISTTIVIIGSDFTTPIRIVTSPWPLYEFNDNGQLKGTDVDVIREAFSRMGIPVKIEMYPWSRCL